MEEAFSDLLSRVLFVAGEGLVDVMQLDPDYTSGILRVDLQDGRQFSVHFHPCN